MSNWIWQGLVLVSGFVIPRLISDRLGSELLGIWDLGWTLVVYVRWVQLGIAGSIARYVARYRAVNDFVALNQMVNSSLAVLAVGASVGVAIGVGVAAAAPQLLPEGTSPEAVAIAGTIALLLIFTVISDLVGSALNSVITGCERFDVLNLIRGARDLLIMIGMIVLLCRGSGLLSLAVLTLCGSLACTLAWIPAAKLVCPQLRFSTKSCSWSVAKRMIAFGGTNVVQSIARSTLYQVNGLLVVGFLGVPALAVFARQRALVLQGLNFIKHYAQVFIPTSSALHARNDHESLQRLYCQSSKYGLYAALPPLLGLLLMGGPILNVWMGPEFEAPGVLAILAAGHLFSIPQQGAYMILLGMNKHARPAAFEVASAVLSIGLGFLFIKVLEMQLLGAALAIALPIALFAGIVLPIYGCRQLQLRFGAYLKEILPGPALANLPLVAVLVAVGTVWSSSPARGLTIAIGAGGVVTACVYLRWVIPPSIRSKVMGMINRKPRDK